MRVLFLMFVFPDMNKSFNMYTTLVEEFVNHRHDVVVLAPGNTKTFVSVEKNIEVLRVQTLPIKNVPNYLKGISNLILPYQYATALNKFYKEKSFDLIIIPTPPITLVDLAAKLKKKFNASLYLVLRDMFPQNAVDLGFMKKGGILYNYFRRKEKKLYKEADFIGCMSEGNIDYVLQHNNFVNSGKLHELKNFQKPYKSTNNSRQFLKEKYKINNKFVVVFGGNMGKPQQLENVLTLAQAAMAYPDIVFLLLGEGVQMNRISGLVEKQNISNIYLNITIPKQEYQDLISICDIGLISLHQDFTIPNIPSKALDYLNVGLPILASLDKATDFGSILDRYNLGLWVYATQPKELIEKLLDLYHNRELRETMGKNGKAYFNKYLLPDIAYNTIIQQVSKK
ncbi:MAG: glycosyltransferase family 4 protein [Bacteroidales bacterium]|jgi:glycosyltransferase involved in cell wall biosynthesis|nr:glycosyltransferase family 4 protein [Bacteroidales bacterium]